ncbi:hypothetical protein HBB16_13360 [Pseudonocardia sp. MCCB 268]|nr:hypothetical protein [Pseudonocardia cytotoxica]
MTGPTCTRNGVRTSAGLGGHDISRHRGRPAKPPSPTSSHGPDATMPADGPRGSGAATAPRPQAPQPPLLGDLVGRSGAHRHVHQHRRATGPAAAASANLRSTRVGTHPATTARLPTDENPRAASSS